MRKILCVITVALIGSILVSSTNNAQARPKYKTTFDKQYKELKAKVKTSCNVCHVPKKKKTERNNYGAALLKSLKGVVDEIPKKGVADVDKIKEALTKAEKEKSAVKDKTFGDLIKDGKLPASK